MGERAAIATRENAETQHIERRRGGVPGGASGKTTDLGWLALDAAWRSAAQRWPASCGGPGRSFRIADKP